VAFFAIVVAFSWPSRDIGSATARIYAGTADEFEAGQPVTVPEGKFHLVKQEDGSFIALFWRSPFRGCTVAWREDLRFTDPRVDPRVTPSTHGWFRDPCHGATFDVTGRHVFGPSPRDMDRFPVEIVGDSVYVLASERHIIRGDPVWCTYLPAC
jgi:nitrite reductase/ring-hydroxylating ferredoxin subunit